MSVQRDATRATGNPGGEAGLIPPMLPVCGIVAAVDDGVVAAIGFVVDVEGGEVSMDGRVIDVVDRMIVL